MSLIKFDEELCIKSKEIFAKDEVITQIWRKHYAPSNKIGNCSNLFRLHMPTDVEDFYKKYITYASLHQELNIRDRGLSEEEIIKLANEYKEEVESYSEKRYDISEYINDMLCHIIIETFNGHISEIEVIKYLNSLGYECGYVDGYYDAKYGIDIVVKSPTKFFIQVKPFSFFLSKRYDTKLDQTKLYDTNNIVKEEFGINTFYVIYSKDRATGKISWIKNKKTDSFCFRLSDIYDNNKNIVINFQKDIVYSQELK